MPTVDAEAFRYVGIDREDVVAIKALSEGQANEFQQKRALSIIVKNFSRMYDVAFVPDAPDQSAFLAGRMYVGSRILYYVNYPASKLEQLPAKESPQ